MIVSLIVSAPITDSYGVNVLAAQLKKLKHRGVNVRLFYIFYKFNEPYPQDNVDELVNLCRGSDLIGISLLSSAYRNSVQITRALREKIGCPIIWGGKHPTADPEDSLKYADIVALSEGEDTLLEIVQAILDGTSYNHILGTWVKNGNEVIKNPLRPIETNLDKFLFPDYSFENKYILDTEKMRIRPVEIKDLESMRSRYPTMITRGCPNCCTFCTNSTDIRLRNMRARSIDNVIEEVRGFLNDYPDTKKIMFRDDCLSAMPLSYIREFTERWKKEVGLTAGLSGVIATSDDFREKIRLLTDAGFVNFKMGIQSGCERVRRFVFARVGETDEVIKKGVKDLHDICNGRINYYMITDNPYESEDELIASIKFTSRLARPFSLSLYSLNFYPGTALFNRATRDGILKDKAEALQESTMDFKNTYLNKVFLSLRYFSIPPFMVSILTGKKLYKNRLYQKVYNRLFKFIFDTPVPNRWIKAPKKPEKFWSGGNFKNYSRWITWEVLSRIFNFYHKKFVKTN